VREPDRSTSQTPKEQKNGAGAFLKKEERDSSVQRTCKKKTIVKRGGVKRLGKMTLPPPEKEKRKNAWMKKYNP